MSQPAKPPEPCTHWKVYVDSTLRARCLLCGKSLFREILRPAIYTDWK